MMNEGDVDTISPPDLSQKDVSGGSAIPGTNDITMQLNGDISEIVADQEYNGHPTPGFKNKGVIDFYQDASDGDMSMLKDMQGRDERESLLNQSKETMRQNKRDQPSIKNLSPDAKRMNDVSQTELGGGNQEKSTADNSK